MVAKKDPKDKFKRITFTASPVLEKNVIEKAKAEKRTISGVIVELLEKWLSGEPIHTDTTNTNLSLPSPPTVDIAQLKAEILSEVMKEISTKEKENKTLEPVQSTLVHTDITDMNQSIEAPIPAERDESHTNIPPEPQDPTETYEAGLVRRFKEWMHQHGLNEKSFREKYGFDVSKLKQWGTGERSFPKNRAQEMEDAISGICKPKTDSH